MVLNSVGNMGENVVLGWLTLELTNSPFMVGVAMSMRPLPLFFLGVPAGALADRVSRRHLLIVTSLGQALVAASLGTVVLFGAVSVAHVMLFTLATGVLRALEHAARQSYAHDVVGRGALVSGLAFLGVAMRAGWLVGSLGVGAVIARWGAGAAYMAVAAGFLGGALALASFAASKREARGAETGTGGRRVPLGSTAQRSDCEVAPRPRVLHSPLTPAAPGGRPSPSPRPAPESLTRAVLDFLVLVRRDRTLLVLMMLTAGAEVLGFAHQTVLPSLARDILHVGPEGLGALYAARAVGGVVGLAAATRRGGAGGAAFLGVLVTFGVSLIVLGGAPYAVGFVGVAIVVVIVNAAGALADLFAQSLLQLSVPSELRGRAGGARVVAIGLAPLGQLQIGALASAFGVSVALASSGFALVILAAATALLFPRLKRV
jgi:hypothetical protein